MFLFSLLCVSSTFITCISATSSALPEILRPCYKNVTRFPLPPLTISLLVELVRKLENDKGEPHIRVLTNAILHTAKFDGIQRSSSYEEEGIWPYAAWGKEFFKYQFLVDHLTPGDALQFPNDALNLTEFCILHYIVSNTIDLAVRGNEKFTCATIHMSNTPHTKYTELPRSNCPLEQGVIKSKWGPISAGHLVAGIASALQRDSIPLGKLLDIAGRKSNFSEESRSQLINNVWMSTIVGDLAEVLINQGSSVTSIGSCGYWNDTLLPRNYYLEGYFWDMSEAELLGGVDGMALASRTQEWMASFPKLRFSQLIDMYYSDRGVAFDPSYKACHRKLLLDQLLKEIDLETQLSATTKILQSFGGYGIEMPEKRIDEIANIVIQNYTRKADLIFSKLSACKEEVQQGFGGRQEIVVIFDETWSRYQAETFIAYLTEIADVSYYGNKIGILNGQNGAFVTNITNDLIAVYAELSNSENWPTRLSLSESLLGINFHYKNNSESFCEPYKKPYGKLILFMAQSTYPSDLDLQRAISLLESIKGSHPETKIMYVTGEENSKSFNLLAGGRNGSSFVLKSNNPRNVESIVHEIAGRIRRFPMSIINSYCNESSEHYEDYLTPGLESVYEIRGEYIVNRNITVNFKGNDYGDISICIYDSKSVVDKICKGITVNSEITFIIKDYCLGEQICSIGFSAMALGSNFKCSEYDCRYPNQIRMDIRTSWSGCKRLLINYVMLLNVLLLLFHYYLY